MDNLRNIYHVSINQFLCLKMPKTNDVKKILHDLKLSQVSQNYYAKLYRRKSIRNVDRTSVKELFQKLCQNQPYSLPDFINMTKQVALECYGMQSIFESEHLCHSCNRLVKFGHTDASCNRGKINDDKKCHFEVFSCGQIHPCLRQRNANHIQIHSNMISNKFMRIKLPEDKSDRLKLTIDSALQWSCLRQKLDMHRSLNVINLEMKFNDSQHVAYVIKSLLPQSLSSNEVMLAIHCQCNNKCNCNRKTGNTIPCDLKKCSCAFKLVSNFLCLLWPVSTMAATMISPVVASGYIESKMSSIENLAHKNHLILYIFVKQEGPEICIANSLKFIATLAAKLTSKMKISVIYVTGRPTNIISTCDKFRIPLYNC